MANYISETQMARDDKSTLAKLKAQERVKVLVLPDGGDANLIIKINGTRWVIPKGREVEVPHDVYVYIRQKYLAKLQSVKFIRENEMKDLTPPSARSGRHKSADVFGPTE